jgi:hypothetical protein
MNAGRSIAYFTRISPFCNMSKAALTVGGRNVEEADTPAKPADYVIKGALRLVSSASTTQH